MKQINDIKELEVGQTVYIKAEVSRIIKSDTYPLKVRIKGCNDTSFTSNCKYETSNKESDIYIEEQPFKERAMMVSDDGVKWDKRTVFYYNNNLEYPYVSYNKEGVSLTPVSWRFAKELEEETVSIPKHLLEKLAEQNDELKTYLK